MTFIIRTIPLQEMRDITEIKREIYKKLKNWNFHVRAEICRNGVGRRGAVVPRR